jgi:ubiquinone/menaquinone biosynthesis C-methylase UbiE
MIEHTRQLGVPAGCELAHTDGIHIPAPSASVDLVWVCGVLRYSLNVPNPVYDQIAREMSRVLKPGGYVVNDEMYVEQPASDFTRDFEAAGFTTERTRVINRHYGRFEDFIEAGRLSERAVAPAARLTAFYHYHFDSAKRTRRGYRDYMFVWRKPDH